MTHIVTGYYGSGKTEFVLNLATHMCAELRPCFNAEVNSEKSKLGLCPAERDGVKEECSKEPIVTIADLDVINPYFRSRERATELAPLGVEIMGSAIENHVAQDIPALSFAFLSRIRSGQNVIIDLAGGENGLKLLAGCYDSIKAYEFLCVLNLYRGETDTAQKMLDFCKQINAYGRLPITGVVNNGHMLSYTEPSHVLDSQKAVQEVAKALNVPFAYTLAQEDVYSKISKQIYSEKVLTFPKPKMREGWQK